MTEDTSGRDSRPVVLVSACLLGTCCNHEGRASRREAVVALGDRNRLVPICPEVVGGLPVPRRPAEIVGGAGSEVLDGVARVVAADDEDVSDAYRLGAAHAVALAQATAAARAVLKARSPSCGVGRIYDGSFSRALRDGDGVAAAALRRAGVDVCSDEDLVERA